MATTTTNFGWDIPQSTDLVKDGATAIAALGQDIDTALVDLKGGTTGQVLSKASGTDLDYSWTTTPAINLGLTLITTQSFSAAGTVSVNNCFSTTYDHYKIILSLNASAGIALNSRFRVSGTDDTSSNYRTQRLTVSGSSVSAALVATSTSFEVTDLSTEPTIIDCAIYNPFASKKKNVIFTSPATIPPDYWVRSDTFNDTTSFTGISFITTSGTITGTLTVWGYNK